MQSNFRAGVMARSGYSDIADPTLRQVQGRLFRKRREKWGIPYQCQRQLRNQNQHQGQRQRQRTGVSVPHGRCFAPGITSAAKADIYFCEFDRSAEALRHPKANGRFLARLWRTRNDIIDGGALRDAEAPLFHAAAGDFLGYDRIYFHLSPRCNFLHIDRVED
jgi:hypothetical protein